jgi:predicted nucleic-acid-binding Zn-ribbon protein
MNKDSVLCDVEFVGNAIINVSNVDYELAELFPLNVELETLALSNWWEKRNIPKSRKGLDNLMVNFHNVPNIEMSNGLSLFDSYWFKSNNDNRNWDEVNLYEKEFNSESSKLVFLDNEIIPTAKVKDFLPSLNSSGNTPKFLERIGNNWNMVKKNIANPGEALSEILTTQVANAMNIKNCQYSYYDDSLEIVKCELFTNPNFGTVEGFWIWGYDEYLKMFDLKIRQMFLLDFITNNDDRHINNLGVIRNNDTGEVVEFCPIYDNGCSFFYNKEILNENNLIPTARSGIFNLSNKELIEKFWTNELLENLSALQDFQFDKSAIPETYHKRLTLLEQFVNSNVDYILDNYKNWGYNRLSWS